MQLKNHLQNHQIHLPDEKIMLLEIFRQEVIEKNKIVNLISKNDIPYIYERHIIDCLIPLKNNLFLEIFTKSPVLDIGSGGGFPGFPLAIVFDKTKFILSESNKKKYEFLVWVKEKLKLKNVDIINERITKSHNSNYQVITQRASARWYDITKLALSLLVENGYFITWVSENDAIEMSKKFCIDFIYNYNLGGVKRSVVIVKKGRENANL